MDGIPAPLLEQVDDALGGAFPTWNDLEQFLLYRMDLRLEDVVARHENMRSVRHALITEMLRRGRLLELMNAAVAEVPDKADLQAAAAAVAATPPRERTPIPVTTTEQSRPDTARAAPSRRAMALAATAVGAVVLVALPVLVGVGNLREQFRRLLAQPPASPQPSTVTGTLLFERSADPVAGAVVSEPGSNLKSNQTAADGFFTLTQVPPGVDVLIAQHGGRQYEIKLTTRTGGRYAVIPAAPVHRRTASTAISSWTTFPEACGQQAGGPEHRQGFSAAAVIPDPGAPGRDARIRLAVADGLRIVRAVIRGTDAIDVAGTSRDRVRTWEVAPPASISLIVCIAATADAIDSARLQAEHWLEWIE